MELLINSNLSALLISLVLNSTAIYFLIQFWKKFNFNRLDFSFTLVIINIVTFLICFFLRKTSIEMGFALGLFAVFGILRYRTEAVSVKAMSYLFVCIGIAILNSMTDFISYPLEVLLANLVLIYIIYFSEKNRSKNQSYNVLIDELALLKLKPNEQLIWLNNKLGLENITSISIIEVDQLRDTILVSITVSEIQNVQDRPIE